MTTHKYPSCFKAIVLLASLSAVEMVSFDDRKSDLLGVTEEFIYKTESLRPTAFVNDTLNITMDLNVVAIIDFNDQNGFIEISGYLEMTWEAAANPVKNNFTDLIFNHKFWKPKVVLVNALKTTEVIGTDESVKIRYQFADRICSWRPWLIIRGACTPNVKFYPFDEQSCSFKLAASGYSSSELMLAPSNSKVSFIFYEENAEWTIKESSSTAVVENNVSIVEYNMKLSRRPIYYVLNLLAPVILLGLLNVFVFILPSKSGERIGFAVTCFLSYVVLLNMIMEFLPTSAAPLSYLSYYTFVMVLFSAGMSLATVITLRIHHKSEDDPIPRLLKGLCHCFSCQWLVSTGEVTQLSERNNPNSSSKVKENKTLSWEKISSYVDIFFFFGFLGGQVFYSVAYLVPLVLNA